MRIRSILLLLFLTNALWGQKNPEFITLIFKKSNYLFEKTNGVQRMNSLINYTEFNRFENVYLSPENKEKNDTIHIELKADKIFLIHNWTSLDKNSRLILEKGDTVEIDYDKGYPFFKITNRITKRLDVNLESELNLSFPMENYVFFQNNKRSRTPKEEKEYKLALKNYTEVFTSKLKLLLEQDEITQETFGNQVNYVTYYALNTNKDTDFSRYKNDLKNENLIWLKSYRFFLELYVRNELNIKTIKKEIKDFDLKTANNKTKTSDVTMLSDDNEDAFLKIEKSDLFSARGKEYLLYVYLNKISNSENLSDYISIFKKYSTNSPLIEGFESAFLVNDEALKKVTEEVVLFDENKKKTTLSNILEANKGKIIYVDFWASWCAPCRAAFPASRKLHTEFEEVVFLNLSTDANFESWKSANKKEALIENSYIILNYKTSDYLKKLAIDLIPRYLLIDQKGEIANPKAAGPDSNEIRKELQDVLKVN